MNNDNLGVLKLACYRLQHLKNYERKYKCALVKEACMRLRIKNAATVYKEEARRFGDLNEPVREKVLHKINWGGLWNTPLGRFFRKFFEGEGHKKALVQFLLQPEYIRHPKKMREYLKSYGMTDKAAQDEIIRRVNAANELIEGRERAAVSKSDAMREQARVDAEKDYWDNRANLDREFYEEYGFMPPGHGAHDGKGGGRRRRKPESQYERMRKAYERVGLPYHSSDYLTDSQMYYDKGWMRHLYEARGIPYEEPGSVVHNHYYSSTPSGSSPVVLDTKFLPSGSEPKLDDTKLTIDPSISSLPGLGPILTSDDKPKPLTLTLSGLATGDDGLASVGPLEDTSPASADTSKPADDKDKDKDKDEYYIGDAVAGVADAFSDVTPGASAWVNEHVVPVGRGLDNLNKAISKASPHLKQLGLYFSPSPHYGDEL